MQEFLFSNNSIMYPHGIRKTFQIEIILIVVDDDSFTNRALAKIRPKEK